MATSEFEWHPEAILDAETARDWYAERSPLAARGFLLALSDALDDISRSPERWPEKSEGCRHRVFTSQYPYTLIYRAEPEHRIVAVAHQRQKPGYWAGR